MNIKKIVFVLTLTATALPAVASTKPPRRNPTPAMKSHFALFHRAQ